jgi:hypothetical protein
MGAHFLEVAAEPLIKAVDRETARFVWQFS